MFQHLRDFKREKRAEGAICNPFMSKAKKVLSYRKVGEPGQLAVARLPHPRPCMEMRPPPREDRAGGFSIFFTLAALNPTLQSWAAPRSPRCTSDASEGTARGSQYGTHIFKPELKREMVATQFFRQHFGYFQCG